MRILVLIAALAIGLYAINRSLWLDEAWVANSVMEPTLSGMFNYPDWLQTTPPLFLLLVRGAVHTFGLSDFSLRIVPLVLSLAGVCSLMAAASRVASYGFAVLAGALLAFHTTAIEYSHTLKQYSGEMAASAIILLAAVLYLEAPSRRRLCWLAGAFAVTLPLAYAAVFLLPGVVVAIGLRKALPVILSSGVVLTVLYFFFIRPNTSPVLRDYWAGHMQGLTARLGLALVFCVLAIAFMRSRLILIALLPCPLLLTASALHWYPNSPRTRLFVLPGIFLAGVIVAEKLLTMLLGYRNWLPSAHARRILSLGASLFAIGFMAVTGWKQVHSHRDAPEEDYASAVQYLREHAARSDLILVHASAKEGFELYTRMDGWSRPVIYGDTGYPCCRRTVSTGSAIDDIRSKIPHGFQGRIWLFYSARPGHWDYLGRDESAIWRMYLHGHGCVSTENTDFPNLGIGEFDCAGLQS